jgi:hypothetical protein
LLTEEQKNQLIGLEFNPNSLYNPIQDANDNWIISIEEINASDISWLKELTFIEYIIKPMREPKIKPLELPSE